MSNSKLNIFVPSFSPDTAIVKMEMFDIDMAKHLAALPISSEDKKRIKKMMKDRQQGNQFEAKYILGKVAKHEWEGRWIVKASVGLQGLSRDTRNALAKPFYWDVDFNNCQVEILRQLAIKHGWKHEKLTEYCENRQAIFENIQKEYDLDRTEIKTEFIRVLFGGQVNNKTPKWIREEFYPELSIIMENIARLHIDLYKKCEKKSTLNPIGSCCATVLQTEERKCLEALDRALGIQGRSLDVYIHDGGYVRRENKEREFPHEVLDFCSKFVLDNIGYDLKLSIKPIETSFSLPNKVELNEEMTYESVKEQFETKVFKNINASLFYMIEGESLIEKTKSQLTVSFEHLSYQELNEKKNIIENCKFIQRWFKDENIRQYRDVGLYLNLNNCPPDIYNVWNGFRISKVELQELNEGEDVDLMVLYDHLLLLCGNDQKIYQYVLKWIAYLIQFSHIKPGVMLLFRSVPGLGKQLGFYDLIKNMIGEKYCYITQDIENNILGKFNSLMENKIFIILDEMSAKVAHTHCEKLKEMATRTHDTIECKGRDHKVVPSYLHCGSFSNNNFPWKIEANDRRYLAIDSNHIERPSSDYIKNLVRVMGTDKIIRKFYQDMLNMDVSKFSPIEDRPETEFMNDLKEVNMAMELQFMIDFITNLTDDRRISSTDLFNLFKSFVNETMFGSTLSITIKKFSTTIKNYKIKGMDKHSTKLNNGWRFNRVECLAYLKEKKYIDDIEA